MVTNRSIAVRERGLPSGLDKFMMALPTKTLDEQPYCSCSQEINYQNTTKNGSFWLSNPVDHFRQRRTNRNLAHYSFSLNKPTEFYVSTKNQSTMSSTKRNDQQRSLTYTEMMNEGRQTKRASQQQNDAELQDRVEELERKVEHLQKVIQRQIRLGRLSE